MGCSDDGTGGKCGQCEFIWMNTCCQRLDCGQCEFVWMKTLLSDVLDLL